MSPIQIRTVLLASAAVLGAGIASPVLAQSLPRPPELAQPGLPDPADSERLDNKRVEARLQREEKALRDLRQIVLKAQAQGNPVTVKMDGPDPEVLALQQKVNDLEETLRRQTGQMEEMAHNAQLAAKSAAEANDANKQLAARLDALQQSQAVAAAAPPPEAPVAGPPGRVALGEGTGGVLGTIRGGRGGPDIQADPTVRSGPPVRDAAPPAAADEASVYKAARQTLDSGDYVGGAAALQAYLEAYPNSPRAPEANYWLGRTLALRDMQKDAAAAYARALKGWPKSNWAGDAVVRLSSSLVELKDNATACKAVAEFDTRYAATAGAAVKARAKDIRTKAACA